MILNIFLLVIGIGLVLWGADRFTDGASAVARRWNVSELVIGLTVVALGTSLPEFTVSLFSSLRGSADMSVGNILGSNIFNTLVIVGASALMMNISVSRSILHHDIPISFASAIMLYALCDFDGELSRIDGVLLCLVFACFLWWTFHSDQSDSEEETPRRMPLWKMFLLLIIGGGCLVGGGQLLVDNAAQLARIWGVSESVIGLTILAGGTSLPELATSMVAARKGSAGLALGNAIGSNVFNIAFVLGVCANIRPMQVHDITSLDWGFCIFSNVLLWILAFTGKKLYRIEGFLLLLGYAIYLLFLLH